jgi:hypothetical protein
MMGTQEQLLEIGSWLLLTEVVRHYPDEFTIIEMHPGGGLKEIHSGTLSPTIRRD